MAIFNDPVQNSGPNDPNWTRVSTPVGEPQADVSKGLLLKGAGDFISDTTKLAKQEIEGYIHDTAYKGVDTEREKFTQGLEATKNALDNGMIASAVNTASGSTVGPSKGSVFDAHAEDTELPVGLDSGLDRLTQITLAKRSGSLKLNDTDYSGKVLAIAKQLRNQFPGFRDYIDQEVSKASGLPVANSYYQNLMLDVNRQLQAAQAKKDDMGQIMKSNLDVPNIAAYIVQRQNNDPKYIGDAAVLSKIADWHNMKAQQDIDAKKRAESKDDLVTRQNTERANLTKSVTDLIDHFNTDNIQLSGMPTLKSLTTFMEDFAAHGGDTKDLAERTAQLQAYRQMIYQRALKLGNGPDTVIGADEAKKIIDQKMAPIDGWIALANSKSPDLAHLSAMQVQAIHDDDVRDWLFDKDRGAVARRLMAGRTVWGENYFPTWIAGIMKNNFDKPVADLFTQESIAAADPISDSRGRDIVDAVRHAKNVKNPDGSVGVPDPEYYGKMVGLVTGITDPNMPQTMKDQMIKWAFKRPELMDELRKDYKDPITGNWVEGKQAAFNRMTSPAMTASIAENAKVNPSNYQMYKNWTESEYGKIFGGDLKDMNKILEKPYLNAHFGWNNSAKQFVLLDNKNRPISADDRAMGIERPNQVYLNAALEKLGGINRSLANMAKVYEINPGKNEMPLDTYLLRLTQTAGFRPGSNLTNASENMARALIKTNAPEKSLEEIDKMLFGKR